MAKASNHTLNSGPNRFKPTLPINRDELLAMLYFSLLAFIVLASYYIVRALREGFILVDFGAELRSLAVAVSALTLLLVVPLYARLRARFGSARLVTLIYALTAINLVVFYRAWGAGWQIGFVFFVWVGLFGLIVVAQFWALATGSWSESAGRRLFPLIMIGANLGALAGAEIAEVASRKHGMHGLMLIGTGLLTAAALMVPFASRQVPTASRASVVPVSHRPGMMGGFSVVAGDRYLLLVALMVVLLNFVNSVGEFLFAHLVELHVATDLAPGASHDERADYVTHVYARFTLWYTVVGLLVQTFLVSRLFRWIGVGRAATILPALMAASYLLIAFVPVFSIIRFVKIAENAIDYSLMSTVRHALFLPTSDDAKFDGKTAIDTFFWRLGDLLQAGVVWAGVHWMDWDIRQFALMVAAAAVGFFLVSRAVAREYRRRVPDDGAMLPNRHTITPGATVDVRLEPSLLGGEQDALLGVTAYVDGGNPLPGWLAFEPRVLKFSGEAPSDLTEILALEVVNDSGQSVPVTLVPVRTH